ncbi:hypothetical protein PBI_MORRISSEY_41 [Gordonia phage Morrissey]|nr:hypothetical protein PBI_MORRISSEY_41 [Gordonia phage Morrissey]
MTSKTLARAVALLILGAAGAVLIVGCTSGPGSRAGESQFPEPPKAAAESTPLSPEGPDDDAPDITELPFEVQVYASTARSMVTNGTIPKSKVTIPAVQNDVSREYGITLTSAEAWAIVRYVRR